MATMLGHFSRQIRKTDQGEGLGVNLRRLRLEKNLTLDALAQLSDVSRAMISRIERGTSVPTAMVLGKLSRALNIGLSHLVGGYRHREPTLLSPFEQPVFRDPESGLERRSLSPLFPDRMVNFVVNTLPPRASVAFPPHQPGIEEYLYVSRGRIAVMVGDEHFEVPAGSSLFYPGNVQHEFHNIGKETAEFFIVIDDNGAR